MYIQWNLWKNVLNSEVVLFLRFISLYRIRLGTRVAVLNSQVVPISQVVIKTGYTVLTLPGLFQTVTSATLITAAVTSDAWIPRVPSGVNATQGTSFCQIGVHVEVHVSMNFLAYDKDADCLTKDIIKICSLPMISISNYLCATDTILMFMKNLQSKYRWYWKVNKKTAESKQNGAIGDMATSRWDKA